MPPLSRTQTFSTTFVVDCCQQTLLDGLDCKDLGRLACTSTENAGWVVALLSLEPMFRRLTLYVEVSLSSLAI